MKYLFLILLISCGYVPENKKFDYMITTETGTWVCDGFQPEDLGNAYLYDCKHALSGVKVVQIILGKNYSITKVVENTKG